MRGAGHVAFGHDFTSLSGLRAERTTVTVADNNVGQKADTEQTRLSERATSR